MGFTSDNSSRFNQPEPCYGQHIGRCAYHTHALVKYCFVSIFSPDFKLCLGAWNRSLLIIFDRRWSVISSRHWLGFWLMYFRRWRSPGYYILIKTILGCRKRLVLCGSLVRRMNVVCFAMRKGIRLRRRRSKL